MIIPGEIKCAEGDITLNAGKDTITIEVAKRLRCDRSDIDRVKTDAA